MVKRWSNDGQTMVKRWSNDGQTRIRGQSSGQTTVDGETMVKFTQWSNKIEFTQWSNPLNGQTSGPRPVDGPKIANDGRRSIVRLRSKKMIVVKW
mmetsp:Transcript_15724/g.33473  ORF Transcript_15724/g.33473 Transcript_15724/m.33473 type:complete len:95 (-) Transcript_15724:15-299(-)